MKKTIVLIIHLLAYGSCIFAQDAKIYSTNSGIINFKSEAPFEIIKASSKELAGLLDVAKKTFAFKVNIQSFKGFNSELQKVHFNENYMQSNQYTYATFAGKIIEDVDFLKDGVYMVRAKGILNIHGIPQERIIKTEVISKEGKLSVKTTFTVMLADHNIPIPKVVKDKLANEIKVDINSQLLPR